MALNASVWRGRYPFAQTGIPKGTRGFAIPASAIGSTPLSFSSRALRGKISYASKFVQRTIPRLTRFLGAPRLNTQPISLSRLQHRTLQTIQARCNLSTRVLLSRPLKAAGMPRAPTLSRPLQEVGLGTARKFSSHSTFRHVVENTSITTRAFWQADWDAEYKNNRRISSKRKGPSKSRRGMSTRHKSFTSAPTRSPLRQDAYTDEMDTYFMEPCEPSVTTFLHVVLTSNILSPHSGAYYDHRLLPLDMILERHNGFQDRTKHVEAIFTILNSHGAWSKGVTVETLGDADGLVSDLTFKFSGWHEGEVRDLLGNLVDIEGCTLRQQCSVSTAESSGVWDSRAFDTNNVKPYSLPLEFIMPSSANYELATSQVRSPSLGWDFIESDISFPSSLAASEYGDIPSSPFPMQYDARLALSSSFLTHLDESIH